VRKITVSKALRFILLLGLLCMISLPAFAGRTRQGLGEPTVSSGPTAAVPEPGAFALFALGAGFAGYAIQRRQRRRP